MSIVRKLLPHVNIILGLMFLTFYILDKFNGAMNFIANDISKGLLLAFTITSMIDAAFLIQNNRARARRQLERAEEPQQTGHTTEK